MPKDKPKLNLHKAGDMGEMKSILATAPAGPPSDEIDAAFMHSLPIETLLQNPGLHRSYRCGMLTGKKDRYGREEFRRIRIRVDVSGDLMGEFRKASEIGFCDCKVPVSRSAAFNLRS